MKYTLFAFGLAAIAAANPLEARAPACTSGIVEGGACSYNVTCGYKGNPPTETPLSTTTAKSIGGCLTACTNYNAGDTNCEAVNYQSVSKSCQLYSAPFSTSAKNKVWRSAVVYGCG